MTPQLKRLEDGTPYVGRLGELAYDRDEDKVQCHLCGGWFRAIGSSHLPRAHGWTLAAYRDAFRLPMQLPTCSRAVSQRSRANALGLIERGDFGNGIGVPIEVRGARVRPWRTLAAQHPELVRELDHGRNRQWTRLRSLRAQTASSGGDAPIAGSNGKPPWGHARPGTGAPTATTSGAAREAGEQYRPSSRCRRFTPPWQRNGIPDVIAGSIPRPSARTPSIKCGGDAAPASTAGQRPCRTGHTDTGAPDAVLCAERAPKAASPTTDRSRHATPPCSQSSTPPATPGSTPSRSATGPVSRCGGDAAPVTTNGRPPSQAAPTPAPAAPSAGSHVAPRHRARSIGHDRSRSSSPRSPPSYIPLATRKSIPPRSARGPA